MVTALQFLLGLLGLGLVALFMAAIVAGPLLLLRSEKKRKRELGPAAAADLARMTSALFEAPPTTRVEDGGLTAIVEGRRAVGAGEPVEIKAHYGTAIGHLTVTTNLRGAQPRLKLVQKDKLATHFTDRFEVACDEGLLDEETKQAILDYAVRVPMIERIEVTKDGLTIVMPGGPLQLTEVAKQSVASDLALSVELAERLRKRILGELDHRALAEAPRVRVDAYREAVAPDAAADAQAAAEADAQADGDTLRREER